MHKYKKSSLLFTFTVFLLFLMSLAGFYSIYITSSISSDAMIINKLGIIRGTTQRAVKLELNGAESNELINKVDLTLAEFKTDEIKLFDRSNEVMDAIMQVECSWNVVKQSIVEYRKEHSDDNRRKLLSDSEDVWYKANSMVFASQISTEQKISKYKLSFIILFFNIALSVLIIILIKRYVKDALEAVVNYDGLTNIYNRRCFTEFMQQEIIRSERYRKGFSLIMLDIDFFKKINDTYGHDTGDKVLQELAVTVSQSIRKSDLFARIGGEEFAVIAPETKPDEAQALAEKLRLVIESKSFCYDLRLTISLGISIYEPGENVASMYKKADNALYKAKAKGRNRVETSAED